MNELQPQKHNFDVAIRSIRQFSDNLPADPHFAHTKENGGLFGWGDHKVTGVEMNNLVDNVQQKLIEVNNTLRQTVQEFEEVYKAFDYLDREYISSICVGLESANEASHQALQAQEDIRATIENLKKTVGKLGELKGDVADLSSATAAAVSNLDARLTDQMSATDARLTATVEATRADLADRVEKASADLADKVEEARTRLDPDVVCERMNKRLKVAYALGGGALALSLVALGLLVLAGGASL